MAGLDARLAEADAALATLREIADEAPSPNATIRAARRVGWLSDEDAQGAMQIGRDRNLAVHMYHGEIGAEIARRLAGHAAVLDRWLAALRRHAAG